MIAAIVDINVLNPRFGCPRNAQQLSCAFGIEINKDVVRRVLAIHYHPAAGNDGPSWLTFLGHAKDSLWSIDLQGTPHYRSSDIDPLFRYHRWKANLRILDIEVFQLGHASAVLILYLNSTKHTPLQYTG